MTPELLQQPNALHAPQAEIEAQLAQIEANEQALALFSLSLFMHSYDPELSGKLVEQAAIASYMPQLEQAAAADAQRAEIDLLNRIAAEEFHGKNTDKKKNNELVDSSNRDS